MQQVLALIELALVLVGMAIEKAASGLVRWLLTHQVGKLSLCTIAALGTAYLAGLLLEFMLSQIAQVLFNLVSTALNS